MTRILIVDDSQAARLCAREILEPEGFEVAGEARDGDEAVRAFYALRPDAVLLDLVMPARSGLAVLAELRWSDPDAPVVVSAGLGQEAMAADALERGARAWVRKPFQPDELTGILGEIAAKRLVRV